MRTLAKSVATTSIAALLAGLTMVVFDAQVAGAHGAWPGPAPAARWHGAPGWHRSHHHRGWGPAVGLGVVGGLAAGAIAGSIAQQSCYQVQPVYDAYGNFIGNETVNVCN